MIQFQTNSVNNVQPAVNFKAKAQKQMGEKNTDSDKNTLDNPMETVGRSQVNFKAKKMQLSSEALNALAKNLHEEGIPLKHLSDAKDAVIATLKEFKCKNVEELIQKGEEEFAVAEEYACGLFEKKAPEFQGKCYSLLPLPEPKGEGPKLGNIDYLIKNELI